MGRAPAAGKAANKDDSETQPSQRGLSVTLWIALGVITSIAAAVYLQRPTKHRIVYDFVPDYPADDHALKSLSHAKDKPVTIGNKTYHPSFGIFPRGCQWREVTTAGSKHVDYQYWDNVTSQWKDEQPAACSAEGHAQPGPPGFQFNKNSPRSEVVPHDTYMLYRNLWFNNGRWYALVDGPDHVASWKFSRNQEIITLHVDNATAFAESVKWRVVKGDTLLFDFIYFIHPTAIGHWWEMLGPLYSILKKTDIKLPCDQLVLLHLKRCHFMEWVRAMMSVTIGVKGNEDLPPVLLQEETENIYNQITQNLEGYQKDEWVVFERALIVRDLYTGGVRTFLSRRDARQFRAAVYSQYGLPPPAPRAQVPRTITFQRKRANRRIINEEPFLNLLANYGQVRVVEYNGSSSLYEQLLMIRDTGVYISVHTSNLANSPLLQPGSAVIEIIQRYWAWNGLDTSFRDQTALMKDIHHYAWRAKGLNETVYLDPNDLRKFNNWTVQECWTEECVEAHTNVDVIVDLEAVKELLDSRLPLVFAGASVKDAELPWPLSGVEQIEDPEKQ